RSIPVDNRERKLRNVYVFAIEGARPSDLLRLHQATRGRPLPAIDRLISEGLVFERAYTLAPWAIPSHAGWLSSSSPLRHKTLRGTYIADGVTMLPEVLDRAGDYTLMVTANPDFNVERGLTQGATHSVALARGSSDGNDATAVLKIAEEQLADQPTPRFVYLNVNDPQAPYDPPREAIEHLKRPEDAPLPHLTHLWVGKMRLGRVESTRAVRRYVHDLYRGELEVIDQAIGSLFAGLEKRGELDDAIVVLMGLHGEEFYEHGGASHGFTLFEESLRVPLVIRAPTLLAPGRVHIPVDLIDLAPTLVDLLGLPIPAAWSGESLMRVIDDPNPPPRMAVSVRGDGARAVVVG
ncbi:MAG: sulfatase, partial [Nannocystaceae bacterium]